MVDVWQTIRIPENGVGEMGGESRMPRFGVYDETV